MYGSKISAIRLARGYTQEYLARKLNIEQTTYSKIEHDGKAKISDDLLEKIADALGVTINDIKSPTPIIMNFSNSKDGYLYNDFNKEIMQVIVSLLTTFQQQISNQNKLLELLLEQSNK